MVVTRNAFTGIVKILHILLIYAIRQIIKAHFSLFS